MTTGKTLEEAKQNAIEKIFEAFDPADGLDWPSAEKYADAFLEAMRKSGYVPVNMVLSVQQRTAAHNALTLHKYEIQPAFDAILAGVPK
jgi:hypothetical protein